MLVRKSGVVIGLTEEMKGSCAMVASSFLLASTMALSSSSSSSSSSSANTGTTPCSAASQLQISHPSSAAAAAASSSAVEKRPKIWSGRKASQEENKFAPRFDGLRFIETLITAHR